MVIAQCASSSSAELFPGIGAALLLLKSRMAGGFLWAAASCALPALRGSNPASWFVLKRAWLPPVEHRGPLTFAFSLMPELEVDQHGNTIWRLDGAVLQSFMLSTAPVSILMGPIGSGKSVACFLRMWRHANEQHPGRAGIRRTRWAVVRNNYPALRTTTMRTFLDVFPERAFGH